MKIRTLPSVIFATLVAVKRILVTAIALSVLLVPKLTRASSGPTLAVLYFDNNSGDKSLDTLSKGFADMLITDLSASEQVVVVEREKLQALLDEAKLQKSHFFDQKTAVKIGKGLGAKYVVAGAFVSVAPRMRIDVRMIDVATSKVVLSTKAQGKSDAVFELEQELVKSFLAKLNLKFFPDDLPPTKVPDLGTLLSFSEGLALIDKGQNVQAAAALKRVVQKAPAFGLARIRHASILKKLASSKVQRTNVIERSSQQLYAQARQFIAASKPADLSKEQAERYLAYRVLLGGEIASSLHESLQGRKDNVRLVPRKGARKATALLHAYYENQRLLISEDRAFALRFPSIGARLSADENALARELEIDARDSVPAHTMLRFLLHGRIQTPGKLKSYTIKPALADLDPKLAKAALKLSKSLLKKRKTAPSPLETNQTVQVLEILATYHIARGQVEKGIAQYQEILDRFPKLRRWDFFESRIHEQLGIKHSHQVKQRKGYRKALASCDQWKLHVHHRWIVSQRVGHLGLDALPVTLKEVEKVCRKSPDIDKIRKSLYKTFFLKAAQFNDCEWFDLYMKKWLALGGSKSDSAGYRKNYSSCP